MAGSSNKKKHEGNAKASVSTKDLKSRIKNSPYAGVAGMKDQQAKSDAAFGGFSYPGKKMREGEKFETMFKLGKGESTEIILVSEITWMALHKMPTRFNARFKKPDYNNQRCTRITNVGFNGDGTFDLQAGKNSRKCAYCEHETFGNEPKVLGVVLAFTKNSYTKNNGDRIGPRLVILELTERDTAIIDRFNADYVKYGIKRVSDEYPNGTLIGATYRIVRGSGSQSRAIGEGVELVRNEETDKPVFKDPVKLRKNLKDNIQAGKFNVVSLKKAYPYATAEEQKLLLAAAARLNDQHGFVRVDDFAATGNASGGGSNVDLDDDDLFGDSSSASSMQDNIRNAMGEDEEEEEEEGLEEEEVAADEKASEIDFDSDEDDDSSEGDDEADEADEADESDEDATEGEDSDSDEDEDDSGTDDSDDDAEDEDEDSSDEEEDEEDDDLDEEDDDAVEDDDAEASPLIKDDPEAFDEVDYIEEADKPKAKEKAQKEKSKKAREAKKAAAAKDEKPKKKKSTKNKAKASK